MFTTRFIRGLTEKPNLFKAAAPNLKFGANSFVPIRHAAAARQNARIYDINELR